MSASVAVTFTVVSPLDVTANTAEPFATSMSSAAASVTVCGVFQFAGVNVRLDPPLTDKSLSPELRPTLTVTLLDGLVYARSAFESSMNYRSAMILGSCTALEGDDALEGLRLLTEHLLPQRWSTLRAPTRKELAATSVLSLPLTEWSVKISDGPPDDDPSDLDAPVWAGVVPLSLVSGDPVDAPDLRGDLNPGPSVTALRSHSTCH